MIKHSLKKLKKEVYFTVLIKAILSLLPVAIGYAWTGNFMFWNVGLITISLAVGAERLKLGKLAIFLHFLLILACFTALFFAFLIPYLFVLTCAGMAFATIYFTKYGSQIRSLANYTFIPTVYLTCELHENSMLYQMDIGSTYVHFMALTPIALIAILVLYGKWNLMRNGFKNGSTSIKWRNTILHGVELGEPASEWMAPAAAIVLGVLVAASLVIFLSLSRGEWVIWSVASVITLGFSSARKKFTDRLLGVLVGVPLGLLAAHLVPKNELMYVLAVLGIMLTLVIFKHYRLAFGCRCFFVAFAAFVASSTTIVAAERIGNVILGGIIGLIAVYITEIVFNKYILKKTKKRGNI